MKNSYTESLLELAEKVHLQNDEALNLNTQMKNLLFTLSDSGERDKLIQFFEALVTLNEKYRINLSPGDFAARIAHYHSAETIALIASTEKYSGNHICFRLLAYCILELIIRNKYINDDSLNEIRKQFGGGNKLTFKDLPTDLFDIEKELPIKTFDNNYNNVHIPDEKQVVLGNTIYELVAKNLSEYESYDLIKSCFNSWLNESNGRIEVKIVSFENQISHDLDRNIIKRLDANSLSDNDIEKDNCTIAKVSLAKVFLRLFCAAANGGAYSRGRSDADARLAAWESLKGILGLISNNNIKSIYDIAKNSEWYSFSGTPWFYDIAWDFGLICVRPNRKDVVLVAVTDQD